MGYCGYLITVMWCHNNLLHLSYVAIYSITIVWYVITSNLQNLLYVALYLITVMSYAIFSLKRLLYVAVYLITVVGYAIFSLKHLLIVAIHSIIVACYAIFNLKYPLYMSWTPSLMGTLFVLFAERTWWRGVGSLEINIKMCGGAHTMFLRSVLFQYRWED